MKLNKKAFTLIELIVVMAVIGILVLLAMPKFMGHTEKARITQIKNNIKQIENASERYYIDNQDWPRLSNDAYTSDQLESFAQEIKDNTGAIVTLDTDGKYYPIDYVKLQKYVQKPKDNAHYVLQNPVGKIYYLDNLTEEGKQIIEPSDILETPQIKDGVQWVNTIGGSKGDWFFGLSNTSDGGYVTVGRTSSGDGDISELGYVNLEDGLIVKFDSSGNKEWVNIFKGNSSDDFKGVIQQDDGSYIVVGQSFSTNYDMSGLNKGSGDAIVVKYNENGNKEWVKSFGGTKMDAFQSILKTDDNGFVVCGYIENLGVLMKFTATGEIEWQRTYIGTNGVKFYAVKETIDNAYIVTGYQDAVYKTSNLTAYYYQSLIVKYDSLGNVAWQNVITSYPNIINSIQTSVLYDITQLDDGGYIGVGLSFYNNDAIMIKVNSSGVLEWVKKIGGASGVTSSGFTKIIKDDDGKYLIFGYSSDVDGDLANLNKGDTDVLLVKIDESGNTESLKTIGGTLVDQCWNFIKGNDNTYILVGMTESIDNDFKDEINKGSYDAFIMKYK